jgi:hypothetical protein
VWVLENWKIEDGANAGTAAEAVIEVLAVNDSRRPKADAHQIRMKPSGKAKADLQFRRQQSLTASTKTSEAVGQTGMPIFLAVRLLGSGSSHWLFGVE